MPDPSDIDRRDSGAASDVDRLLDEFIARANSTVPVEIGGAAPRGRARRPGFGLRVAAAVVAGGIAIFLASRLFVGGAKKSAALPEVVFETPPQPSPPEPRVEI